MGIVGGATAAGARVIWNVKARAFDAGLEVGVVSLCALRGHHSVQVTTRSTMIMTALDARNWTHVPSPSDAVGDLGVLHGRL